MYLTNKTTSLAFVIFIYMSVFLPAIPLGSISLELSQPLLYIFALLFFFSFKFGLKREFIFIFWFFAIQILMVIGSSYLKPILDEANNLIPDLWYSMYGRFDGDSFFKDELRSFFQLIGIAEIFLVFFITCSISKRFDLRLFVLKSVKLFLVINVFLSIFQIFVMNEDRAYGATSNAQLLGVVVICSIIVIKAFSHSKLDYMFFVFLGVVLIVLSGTKSSLVTFLSVVFLLHINSYRLNLISFILAFFVNFFISVVFAILFQEQILSLGRLIFSDMSTMQIRYLMWGSAFSHILSESPFFGAMGRVTEFPDNIFWYFLVSYGYVGLFVFIVFFYILMKKKSPFIVVMLFSFFLQGISFYGFMVKPVSYLWWMSLAFIYSYTGSLSAEKELKDVE
ncbi:hypothetical protein [Vibrio campbellii]|uniref:hypothetical protein n=1 Tax=Vibrio campbellii TaxID=680 RepID=UPI0003A6E2CD|nr:hypothetical protein [Vibrio campbellii]